MVTAYIFQRGAGIRADDTCATLNTLHFCEMTELRRTLKCAPAVARILTVADHEMSRDWLRMVLRREPTVSISAEASDAGAALSRLEHEIPELAIVALPLSGSHGLEIVHAFRERCPRLPVLVFGGSANTVAAEACMRAGARGYVGTRETKRTLLAAVRRLLEGGIYISQPGELSSDQDRTGSIAPEVAFDCTRLSARERELLMLLGSGYKPTEIALQMNLSIRTFESYSARIRQKLNLTDSRELLRCAVAWMRTQSQGSLL